MSANAPRSVLHTANLEKIFKIITIPFGRQKNGFDEDLLNHQLQLAIFPSIPI